jgi:hypothetical protein
MTTIIYLALPSNNFSNVINKIEANDFRIEIFL